MPAILYIHSAIYKSKRFPLAASMPDDLPITVLRFFLERFNGTSAKLRDEDERLSISRETSISSQFFLFPLTQSTYVISVLVSLDATDIYNQRRIRECPILSLRLFLQSLIGLILLPNKCSEGTRLQNQQYLSGIFDETSHSVCSLAVYLVLYIYPFRSSTYYFMIHLTVKVQSYSFNQKLHN